jgi:hypothetical protein
MSEQETDMVDMSEDDIEELFGDMECVPSDDAADIQETKDVVHDPLMFVEVYILGKQHHLGTVQTADPTFNMLQAAIEVTGTTYPTTKRKVPEIGHESVFMPSTNFTVVSTSGKRQCQSLTLTKPQTQGGWSSPLSSGQGQRADTSAHDGYLRYDRFEVEVDNTGDDLGPYAMDGGGFGDLIFGDATTSDTDGAQASDSTASATGTPAQRMHGGKLSVKKTVHPSHTTGDATPGPSKREGPRVLNNPVVVLEMSTHDVGGDVMQLKPCLINMALHNVFMRLNREQQFTTLLRQWFEKVYDIYPGTELPMVVFAEIITSFMRNMFVYLARDTVNSKVYYRNEVELPSYKTVDQAKAMLVATHEISDTTAHKIARASSKLRTDICKALQINCQSICDAKARCTFVFDYIMDLFLKVILQSQ